jgi:hypothetical protein
MPTNIMRSNISLNQYARGPLVGVLILRQGSDILGRLVSKSCSADVQAIIEFVATDHCDQYI